jgi:hypothetical protein
MPRLPGRASLAVLVLTLPITAVAGLAANPTPPAKNDLVFDPGRYTVKTATLDGKTVTYRAYEGLAYVKRPVDATYQKVNIFVPEIYYRGETIGNYSADTAPIFLPNTVGGYMPGPAGSPGQGFNGGPNAALVALSKGYVVAAPGVRGRTNVDGRGRYTGKAPACIVDLKAAVRYLRFNDKLIPGNAEKIISNGTSAGGALSALLGASGNNADYEPYLKALGAAEARDDVFAVSAYCPITDLDHADMAYEWVFGGVNEYSRVAFHGPAPGPGTGARAPGAAGTMAPGGPDKPTIVKGTMSSGQIRASAQLKALFPGYLNGLGLKRADGAALALDADGSGSFKDLVKSCIIASAQKALKSGVGLSGSAWLTIRNGVVADFDFDAYVRFATRMKVTPAFDGLDLGAAENELFGTETVNARHFTAFGQEHGTGKGTLADPTIVKLMNPMNYAGAQGTTTARFWRIRHGSVDRDTSPAISTMLATKLANSGCEVDFALPWGVGHSGDYDLDDLFTWMARVCR